MKIVKQTCLDCKRLFTSIIFVYNYFEVKMLNIVVSPITAPVNCYTNPQRKALQITFQGLNKDVFESTTPVVTKLTRANFKEIYSLYLKYRESANVKSSIQEVKKFLNDENRRTEDEIFAAKIGEKPVGFLHFGKEYSTLSGNIRYRMKALFVDEDYQGKGIAKKLVKAMQDFAGDKEVIVKARRSNEHSPYLYPRTGFHEDDKFIHFVYKKD